MKYELSQKFYFEAAHTLERAVEAEGSRRIHGHTYHAEITLTGTPDPVNGMLTDLGVVRGEITRVRDMLDHRFLDGDNDSRPGNTGKLVSVHLYRDG